MAERPATTTGEFTDRLGACELKARIEEYWRARGHEIQVILVEAAFNPALRACRVDVRSDLVNGLPRGAVSG
jgi:hypothetical protein